MLEVELFEFLPAFLHELELLDLNSDTLFGLLVHPTIELSVRLYCTRLSIVPVGP